MIKQKISKSIRPTFYISSLILIILSTAILVGYKYKINNFKDSQIDEILFYLSHGLNDGQKLNTLEIIQDNLLFGLIVLFILLLPIMDVFRNKILIKFNFSFLGKFRKKTVNPSSIRLRYKFIYSLIIFISSFWLLASSFGTVDYIKSNLKTSTIFENNYVDPKSVDLKFPEQKKNLIYIYLESMENTVASIENGGQSEASIIPELESIALDPNNISFSNTDKLGGALPAYGTTWTVGAMTAQMTGAPLKRESLGIQANDYGEKFNTFLPGAYGIGSILKENGYNQTFLMGSKSSFGGRDKLLKQHGDFKILDVDTQIKSGKLPEDYDVWWGYEDAKLFDFARQEISNLASKNQPFNVQLLTVDTHFPDGYKDETCPIKFEKQYDNVHACSSSRVAELVEWIQNQPFGKDTVIVIAGDHLGMQTSYYAQKIKDQNYTRTGYNAFINSQSPVVLSSKNRLFSSFDLYPTTLAALGVEIPGNKLGLGVNLFSEEQTIIEKYGNLNTVNEELKLRSKLYSNSIILNKK